MPTVETKRSRPALTAFLILLLLVVATIIIRSFTRETIDVRVSPVTHENLISPVSANGKVEPIGMVQAHAPAPGVVKRVLVDVGEKVQAGQLLIQLDDADVVSRIASATSTLRTAQANASDLAQGGTQDERNSISGDASRARLQQQQATSDLAALKALQAKGAASAAEVAAAQQRLDNANATLSGAQLRLTKRYSDSDRLKSTAQIAEARQALAAAQLDYTRYNVRAPFAGTVYSIPVSATDFVPA